MVDECLLASKYSPAKMSADEQCDTSIDNDLAVEPKAIASILASVLLILVVFRASAILQVTMPASMRTAGAANAFALMTGSDTGEGRVVDAVVMALLIQASPTFDRRRSKTVGLKLETCEDRMTKLRMPDFELVLSFWYIHGYRVHVVTSTAS
jgi:hypothetical protein